MFNILAKETVLIRRFKSWSQENLTGVFLFNITLMVLILLHAAGYFEPYLPITINIIVFTALILTVILFNARSGVIFFAGLLFWIFAGLLRVLYIDVWAERTAIYAYQALMLGVLVLIIENIRKHVE